MEIRMKLLVLFTSLILFTFSAKAAENYTIDPSHTAVLWHINHLGFSNPSGKWMAEGTLELDEAKPQNSKVNITIQVAHIVTGIDELNKHLKSKLFFDVEKFPTATFVSNKITMVNKNTAKVHGILTVHGVSKPITLSMKFNKSGMNPISNKQTVGFSGTAQLKRSDFGMNAFAPGLGDVVKINIEAEAYKAA
jgi:polyisoprenoid-binding protein YceI